MIQHALTLARMGFYVFPLVPEGKKPAIDRYPELATRDENQIREWWGRRPRCNVGISTSAYKSDQANDAALLVVDFDTKYGKSAIDMRLALELYGLELPNTLTQVTPTGGTHLLYTVPAPLKQGVDIFKEPVEINGVMVQLRGVDTRSRGGYVVAAGSKVEAGEYKFDIGSWNRPTPAPGWLIEFTQREKVEARTTAKVEVNEDQATARAVHYLKTTAPLAVQGEGGDQTTFKVACVMKDMGLSESAAFEAMADHWNGRCQPPWDAGELRLKVGNAYAYAQNSTGAQSAEAHFADVPDTEEEGETALQLVRRMNKEYALVLSGGKAHVLWETKDANGEEVTEHLALDGFRQLNASRLFHPRRSGAKPIKATKVWEEHPERRTYHGICFRPGREVPPHFYNLWRGFSVEPLARDEQPTPTMQKAVDRFLEHARLNVCRGKADEFEYLMNYLAHMIQRPWEKPLTALVLKGEKGVGKNAIIECVGALLGPHFLVGAGRRYLTGNFNSHLENLVFFALDEAFWSGEKGAEGILKDMITGKKHVIERKGLEPYTVDNCLRVAILSNEDWVVPASTDERRFTVFTVGNGRKQDTRYFNELFAWMKNGGDRALLSMLLSRDISDFNPSMPLVTDSLLKQKLESLDPVGQWIFDALMSGRIEGVDFDDGWPETLNKISFRDAYNKYAKERNIRAWSPTSSKMHDILTKFLPGLVEIRPASGERHRLYRLPSLQAARTHWEKMLAQAISWPKTDDELDLQDLMG